jgi:DUF1365 family protein
VNAPQPAIYLGTVTHKRLRPVTHELKYQVASFLVDVDALAAGRLPQFLSHNRSNLFSIHDKDHGECGSSQSIATFAWGKVAEAGLSGEVTRILMLVYPRILGYAFNPLTTYFALDREGHTRLMIYEVHNTFGGRHCYVSDPVQPGETVFHQRQKVFRVSPFNDVEGTYSLRATDPGVHVAVGVALSTAEGPLLKAYFAGARIPLTNASLVRVFLRLPLQSLKVIGGIHWEALKLWLKGLNLAPAPPQDKLIKSSVRAGVGDRIEVHE